MSSGRRGLSFPWLDLLVINVFLCKVDDVDAANVSDRTGMASLYVCTYRYLLYNVGHEGGAGYTVSIIRLWIEKVSWRGGWVRPIRGDRVVRIQRLRVDGSSACPSFPFVAAGKWPTG